MNIHPARVGSRFEGRAKWGSGIWWCEDARLMVVGAAGEGVRATPFGPIAGLIV